MNDPLYTAEVERLKDCNKDYRSIAAQSLKTIPANELDN